MNPSQQLPHALPKGTILKSPHLSYKIEEVLGSGGFGITYKVSAEVLVGKIPVRTFFAVKEHFIGNCCHRENGSKVVVTETSATTFDDSKKCFLAEARRMNDLSGHHPGLVRVNEVFEANQTVYYVMEYLNGTNLRTYTNEQGGCLSEAEALAIMQEVGQAVMLLHHSRITHLDIKPDNILLHIPQGETSARPVLIDFGLAKHYDETGAPTSTINITGCSHGYSPMEQYVKIAQFSPTADVYAFTATMLFLLTGKNPPIASEMSDGVIDQLLPPDVTGTTRQAIKHGMQKDVAQRTPNMETLLEELFPVSTTATTAEATVDAFDEDTIACIEQPSKTNATATSTIAQKKALNPVFYIVAALVCCIIGYFCFGLFIPASDDSFEDSMVNNEEMPEVMPLPEQEVVAMAEPEPLTEEGEDTQAQAPANHTLQQQYQNYLHKADSCCDIVDKLLAKRRHDTAVHQILEASSYYYEQRFARGLHTQLYGTAIAPNERIDNLKAQELKYWQDEAAKCGKNRRKFAYKRDCLTNAMLLSGNTTFYQPQIDWLNAQLKKGGER